MTCSTTNTDRFQLRKCGYSRKPWRIIDTHATPKPYSRGAHPEGAEVWTMEALHLESGTIVVPGPLAFDRKRDAVAALAALDLPAVDGAEGRTIGSRS